MSSAGFGYAEYMAGQKEQTYLRPWCCPSPWLTSPPVCWSGLHNQLHIQHSLAHSQLSDFSCSILIWPQKQQAGDGQRKWRGLHPLLSNPPSAGREMSKGAGPVLECHPCWHLLCHPTHDTVWYKTTKDRQTDRHPHPCWVAVHY